MEGEEREVTGLDKTRSRTHDDAASFIQGEIGMALHFVLLCGLVGAKGGTCLPPRPDFAALIPQTSSSIFFRSVQDRRNLHRPGAVALTKYLNRLWDVTAAQDVPLGGDVASLLIAIEQFDATLLAMNPNPTVGEAVARVRAYAPVLALARREIKRDEANPRKLLPGCSCPIRVSDERLNEKIQQVYYPLFARSV